jgi:hypothetical protein
VTGVTDFDPLTGAFSSIPLDPEFVLLFIKIDGPSTDDPSRLDDIGVDRGLFH